jgi:predicted  nucleic acid-binding Zn-ribbon protein
MPLIENLLTLHRVDTQVRALRSRVEAGERDLAREAKLLGVLQRQEQELAMQIRQFDATVKNLELEIQGIQERVDRLRNDLNSSQNDKQYKAILAELKTLEGKKGEFETRAVTELERSEQVKARLAEVGGQLAERKKIHDVVKAQLDERKAECGGRLAELEAERNQAARGIPDKERKVFERVLDTCEGEAMSEVEEISRRHREYACGACRMELPFGSVSMLASDSNAMVQCKTCGRILFLTEETREVLVKK